jgi:drug/metabolite transporter (DMT)-like permease
MNFASSLVLLSEMTLASYPILIKAVPTNLWTQILGRMVTYAGIALFVLLGNGGADLFKIKPLHLFGAGGLNLTHIATSYKAFEDLPAGDAMSIFYAYPVWNLIGAWLLFGETIPTSSLPWVGLATMGMLLIAQPKGIHFDKPLALISALLSGMTESGIYFFFRLLGKKEATFRGMLELYGGSFLWMLPALLLGETATPFFGAPTPKVDWTSKAWIPMILFNSVIGFTGYAMRFWAIPQVSTVIFSVLSFIGVVASYLFGYLFQGEKPTMSAAVGAAAIVIANGVLLSKNGA